MAESKSEPGTGEKSRRGRRTSLENWFFSTDVIELVNYIATKYNHPQITDEVDGRSINDPQTIFTKILDHSIIGTGIATAASILAVDGKIFAARNLALTKEQVAKILENIVEPENFSIDGIVVGSDQFVYEASSGATIRGKATDNRYCTIARTKYIVMILVYDEQKKDIAEDLIADLQSRFQSQGI